MCMASKVTAFREIATTAASAAPAQGRDGPLMRVWLIPSLKMITSIAIQRPNPIMPASNIRLR